jgi:two-component system LytT family response regulator
MPQSEPVSVVIIDDDKDAIFTLQSFLEMIPEVEVKGTASNWQKAIKLIRDTEPEMVFLDVEMPGKTGFELLKELDNQGISRFFKVVFYTAYDKYSIRALREAAFDYILKPPTENEVREAVGRVKAHRVNAENRAAQPYGKVLHQMIAIPTSTGLQFFPKAEIVYIECQKNSLNLRSFWVINLNNQQNFRLRPNTNATTILDYLGNRHFIPISQSAIVNISFVRNIEFKSNLCYLFPPFENKPLKISRQFMTGLKERFEIL